jgi:hypothetical protein
MNRSMTSALSLLKLSTAQDRQGRQEKKRKVTWHELLPWLHFHSHHQDQCEEPHRHDHPHLGADCSQHRLCIGNNRQCDWNVFPNPTGGGEEKVTPEGGREEGGGLPGNRSNRNRIGTCGRSCGCSLHSSQLEFGIVDISWYWLRPREHLRYQQDHQSLREEVINGHRTQQLRWTLLT